MGTRRRARALALQVLYGIELAPGVDPTEHLAEFIEHFRPGETIRPFFLSLVHGTLEQREALDRSIDACSDHWRVARMPAVDRNLLRVAAFELLHVDEVPPEVTISEAVDLAKRYGGSETPRFVNAVLDRLARDAGLIGPDAVGLAPAPANSLG